MEDKKNATKLKSVNKLIKDAKKEDDEIEAKKKATEKRNAMSAIGHGIGGKYIPIMAHLAKARRWSKQ